MNKIFQGHSLEVLKTLDSESINCIMTSPPFWALRDYGNSVETIWDAQEGCEHEWKIEETYRPNSSGGLTEKQITNKGSFQTENWDRPSREAFENRDVNLICSVCNKQFEGKPNQKFCSKECLNTLSNEERQNRVQISNFCSKCGAWKGQLGLEPTFDLYIKHLCDIFDEVKRVLRKDGTCWVNLGDTYSNSGKGAGGDIKGSKQVWTFNEKEKRICNNCGKEFIGWKFQNFCGSACSGVDNTKREDKGELKSKSLCNIPARFSIEMQNRGWILRNIIIWHKPNCMPSSVKDRFTVDFEYLFFFVKNKKYWFETQYEPQQQSSIERMKYGWNGNEKRDDPSGINNHLSKYIGTKKGQEDSLLGRNKRTVWRICPRPFKEAHFATYPEGLCEIPIKAGCPVGGIILDPFFGAGTTGLVALKQNKQFIGIELNPEYIKIAEKRLKQYLCQTKLS